ncbi:hypothetical protein AR457_26400 [Streptomyces agglomeratus]|uniref:Uncharacterized protein n=1 Tax=Streptomyces agglomeratus TaxID=285458 RepID=A0A1E5PD53_9ACTN|nr:hypothetical protein [Streptomyces agglomeratus]OEJ27469.1 hypothetical protein AS594_26275 [Streptomyces agglomeratus]OEJ38474.1 hypothetical protein BGK70_10255 [Streptomyces agglomeratus]OEJ47141.1 hypothetical protein AR457_26400 [Streptomyces agglomeratus]OEJ51002.1 hypothetical protein BGK72_09740 [Streptomyces agglomeratus]OEJ58372.1 hypothetical protein BGM19_10650 [Streptomyces agglomeratus]
MSGDRPTLPPVRLHSDAELAREALTSPLLARAARLARWAGPATRVGAGGELVDEQLPKAAGHLGLSADEEGAAEASEAWRLAVDTGLVEVTDAEEGAGGVEGVEGDADAVAAVTAGENLTLLTAGSPQDVLAIWLDAFDAVFADATAPVLDDLAEAIDEDGQIDLDALDWDPEAEAEFLEGVLGNLYLLTVSEGAVEGPVPLPALAASMIVPEDMGEPTDDVLEQVSDAMMRLDDQFRVLEPIGLVVYRPVDEALMAEEGAEPEPPVDDEDVSRYGMVGLTPLGLYGVRARMLEAGMDAPAVGDLADKGAEALLDGIAYFPEVSAGAETQLWLARREPAAAARELLAAARGTDKGAPLRRLRSQQALSLVGQEAEDAVREVLDDAELGGLARVWLAEHGASDVPPPPEPMIFWLAIDTIAAQLDAAGEPDELQGLVAGLTGRHSGFFDAAWRVDHPATADVLEAMGRLHPDKKAAKEARKAAFKARSRRAG